MGKQDFLNGGKGFITDSLSQCFCVGVILVSLLSSTYISLIYGILIFGSFSLGCILSLLLVAYKEDVNKYLLKLKHVFGYKNIDKMNAKCDICEVKQCQRHNKGDTLRDLWKELMVDKNLDSAVESFYTRILNSFVKSWFSLLSQDDDFIQTLKQGLREATCHIIRKITKLDASNIITYKLLPIVFDHIEAIECMMKDGVALDKLPNAFIQNDRAIHPAVANRKAEIDYLRAIAKCLIPRIFQNENFDSKIFFSLVRELIACWVFLPLMDVISDPNLINLMIIHSTDKGPPKVVRYKRASKVEFLQNFASKNEPKIIKRDSVLLRERDQLYAFMQFLKREGAVDLLRFYLDVDNLNNELQDPKITTDPAKLSSLYQYSEKLLEDYKSLTKFCDLKAGSSEVTSLTEAHENVKASLEGKWRKAFTKTPECFKLAYDGREIKFLSDNKNSEHTGAVSRLGTKLKDAIRGAIDGAPLDATEVPTVWDAFAEPHHISQVPSNPTIYNSVACKLRKERGQNLDSFLVTFMQSLEQTSEVRNVEIDEKKERKCPKPLGRNLVFGNLFGLNRCSKNVQISSNICFNIKGPSQCLLYIMHRILKLPPIFVSLVHSAVCISSNLADSAICYVMDKLIRSGLYEPRLAVLIRSLEVHLFDTKSEDISPTELLERQRQARKRMEKVYANTGHLVDALQSPALNKHLMYCLFDVVIGELYPELRN